MKKKTKVLSVECSETVGLEVVVEEAPFCADTVVESIAGDEEINRKTPQPIEESN